MSVHSKYDLRRDSIRYEWFSARIYKLNNLFTLFCSSVVKEALFTKILIFRKKGSLEKIIRYTIGAYLGYALKTDEKQNSCPKVNIG